MENIFKRIFNPQRILIFFILFVISVIFMSEYFDYTYKKLKTIIALVYFFPCVLFFAFSSIYNIKMYKKAEIKTKLIILFPLIIIVFYIIYILFMLGYAMVYR